MNNNNKTNSYRVRPVAPVPRALAGEAISQPVYDIPFSTLIEAWMECERAKRHSPSCIKFRWDAPRNLYTLWIQMIMGEYEPWASYVFMVLYPVLREIWDSAFRDRIVHTWEAMRFGPIIEKYIRECGDNSMNCRKGYGNIKAIHKVQDMMRDFTRGFTSKYGYIVGGDFANFFMSLDRDIIWGNLEPLLRKEYKGDDLEALLYMTHKTLYHDYTKKYYRRSPLSLWDKLPARKSLFNMPGLPIGNLTSQLLANFIGAKFMGHIMQDLGNKDFVIFVDDWTAMVWTMHRGRWLLRHSRRWLPDNLKVTLHPDKVYLQHHTKGTKMVGAVIKPHRTYISNRTRGRFVTKLMEYNHLAEGKGEADKIEMLHRLRSTVNSYLGLMRHHRSYNIRSRICEEMILPVWGKYIYFPEGYTKMIIRRQYDNTYRLRKRLRSHSFARKFLRPKWQEQ